MNSKNMARTSADKKLAKQAKRVEDKRPVAVTQDAAPAGGGKKKQKKASKQATKPSSEDDDSGSPSLQYDNHRQHAQYHRDIQINA